MLPMRRKKKMESKQKARLLGKLLWLLQFNIYPMYVKSTSNILDDLFIKELLREEYYNKEKKKFLFL